MRARSVIHPLLSALLVAVVVGGTLKLTTAFAQSTSNSTAPRNVVIPIRPLAPLSKVLVPPVPGINQYVANHASAVALGKALFWDMQTGSDGVQACASCHFNAGADSRSKNQINPGSPGGDATFQLGVQMPDGSIRPNYMLNPGTAGDGSFGGYHDGDFPLHKQGNVDTRNQPLGDVNDIVGSQGVHASLLDHIVLGSGVDATTVTSDSIFSYPDPSNPGQNIDTRRVTGRNTPSVVNAVFNYRNFWDGRAQNTCNGANPFGERDTSSHFFSARTSNGPMTASLVRLQNSALCSQSLGPPLSDTEMSASNRNWKELGKKLLSVNPLQNVANTTPLGKQTVDLNDSVLGTRSRQHEGHGHRGLLDSYETMVQRAFQPKWWQSKSHVCVNSDGSEKIIDPKKQTCAAGAAEYRQIEYNFSLFWSIAIQEYESTLRADQTPLDQYLAQQKHFTIPADGTSNTFNVTLLPGIVPQSVSVYEMNPNLDSSDQDVFAFDDGLGNVTGDGISQATVDYAGGAATIIFDKPPSTQFPVVVSYSVGTSTPLTQAQIHGLNIFNTKGRCITCHGGPELTNASVASVSTNPLERMVMGDFNVRVYDNGFYNIGVRPGDDDIGIHGSDPFANPLSMSELEQAQVCANPSLQIMIPGRTGEFIPTAPLNCFDDISSKGNFKVPALRNVALTAPYFHNGGQLTLEQVVEFYNRGGDFPDGFDQIPLIDSNITTLGLTMQEKTDLVDFLRNGLTDQRTVRQAAPFDHPELFLANGHPGDPSSGYPVVNDGTGNATDAPYPMMHVPPTGRGGSTPMKTFLQNLLTP